jgi:hypothetical protein
VRVSKCLSWKDLIDTRNDSRDIERRLVLDGYLKNPDFKAVVKLFTEGLYAELLETPVKVTIVYPGGVTTNIAQNSWAAVPGWTGGIEKGSSRVVIGNDASERPDELVKGSGFEAQRTLVLQSSYGLLTGRSF